MWRSLLILTFSAVWALSAGIPSGNSHAPQNPDNRALFLESPSTVASSMTEQKRIREIKSFYRTETPKVLLLQDNELYDGDIVVPLSEGKFAAFRLEKSKDADVWKGRENGKIRMSLRKVKNTYSGYLYSGMKRYEIVGVSEKKLALVEVDTRFECKVGED